MMCLENSLLVFIRLLFCSCLILTGANRAANAQSYEFQDSMATDVAMINEVLSVETSAINKRDFPPTLLTFLQNFRNDSPKKAITQEELHYLAYSYRGYLYALDGKNNNAITEYENGHRFLANAKAYNKFLGHFYLLRANALLGIGDNERGLRSLKDAEEIFAHQKDLYFLSQIYQNESDFYSKNGQLEKALEPLDKSIQLNKKNSFSKVTSLIKRGQLFSQLNRFEEADQDFELAKALLDKNNSQQTGELNAARGQHLLRQQKPAEALTLYDEALEQLCPGIRAEKFAAFKNCINPKAFLSTLQLRGNILSQSISKNTESTTLKNLYNNYITGVRFLQFLQKSETIVLSKEEWNQQFTFFLENGIESCFLLDQLQKDSDLYIENAMNLVNLRKYPGNIQTLQITGLQLLATREERDFLSFFYGEQNIYAFVIGTNGHQFYKIKKDSFLEEDLLQLIAFHHLPLQSIKDIGGFRKLSYDIYQILFKDLTLANEKLVIIPDGLLSFIPFESFVVDLEKAEEHPLHYLLFNKQITYAHSFTQLQKDLNVSPLDTRSVFTFAPMDFKKHGFIPLKGTPGHIRFLEIKFQCKKWINENATVSNFQKTCAANEYNMVVFNTHADAGSSPWICFSDALLPVGDLPAINANIAIFNNCNTDVTKVASSKGVFTISSSLSEKGISATVAPLWSIPHHKSLQVMEYFYLNLASGMEKDEAMRTAKINYLKSCGNDAVSCSPHFWSGPILTGNTQPLYKKSYLLPVVITGLLLLLLMAWKRSQQEIG